MDSTTGGQVAQEMDHTRFVKIVEEGREINNQLWLDAAGLDTLMRDKGKTTTNKTYQVASVGGADPLRDWTLHYTTFTAGTSFSTLNDALQHLCRGPLTNQPDFDGDPADYSVRILAIQDQDYNKAGETGWPKTVLPVVVSLDNACASSDSSHRALAHAWRQHTT